MWYQWVAKTKYYLHSPFVYQFYLNVLEGSADENIGKIRDIRQKLRSDKTVVKTEDFGTGRSLTKRIKDIEATVAVREKYGMVLYRLVQYFKPQNIIELGTSIGISTLYISKGNPDGKVTSHEGSAALADIANSNLLEAGIFNVNIITGNIDKTLTETLNTLPSIDLVFFDANHTKDATMSYFIQCLKKVNENSIFIFDDVYWNREMAEAWEEIKVNPQISLTIDIFQFGICFFTKEKLAKEDFVLKYEATLLKDPFKQVDDRNIEKEIRKKEYSGPE